MRVSGGSHVCVVLVATRMAPNLVAVARSATVDADLFLLALLNYTLSFLTPALKASELHSRRARGLRHASRNGASTRPSAAPSPTEHPRTLAAALLFGFLDGPCIPRTARSGTTRPQYVQGLRRSRSRSFLLARRHAGIRGGCAAFRHGLPPCPRRSARGLRRRTACGH